MDGDSPDSGGIRKRFLDRVEHAVHWAASGAQIGGTVGGLLGAPGGPASIGVLGGTGAVTGALVLGVVGLLRHPPGARQEVCAAALFRQLLASDEGIRRELEILAASERTAGETMHALLAEVSSLSDSMGDLRGAVKQVQGELANALTLGLDQALALVGQEERLRSLLAPSVVGIETLARALEADVAEDDPYREAKSAPQFLRATGPNWVDFCAQVPFIGGAAEQLCARLDSATGQRTLLLHGFSGSGKTVLARSIGFLSVGKRPVLHAQFGHLASRHGHIADAILGLSDAIRMANARDGVTPLLIIEDLRSAPEEDATALLDELDKAQLPALTVLTSRIAPRVGDERDRLVDFAQSLPNVGVWRVQFAPGPHSEWTPMAAHMWQARWALEGKQPPFPMGHDHVRQCWDESRGCMWVLGWVVAGHSGVRSERFAQSGGVAQAGAHLARTVREASSNRLVPGLALRPAVVPSLFLSVACLSRFDAGLPLDAACELIGDGVHVTARDVQVIVADLVAQGEVLAEAQTDAICVALRVPHASLAEIYVKAYQESDDAGARQHLTTRLRERFEASGDEEALAALSSGENISTRAGDRDYVVTAFDVALLCWVARAQPAALAAAVKSPAFPLRTDMERLTAHAPCTAKLLGSSFIAIALAPEPDDQTLHKAVWALSCLRDQRAKDVLRSAARHANEDIRWQAIYGMGELGDAEALHAEEVQRELPAVLEALNDEERRSSAMVALMGLRPPEAVPTLRSLALAGNEHSDFGTRFRAISTLGKISDDASVDALAQVLVLPATVGPGDDDWQFRSMQLSLLARHALEGLVSVGGKRVCQHLARLLDAPHEVASSAASGLAQLGETGFMHLLYSLEKGPRDVPAYALLGVQRSGDPRTNAVLEQCLTHPHRQVRSYAALGLARAGDPRFREMIEEALSKETDKFAQDQMRQALASTSRREADS